MATQRGWSRNGKRVYPGSAPQIEVKAYFLLCVYWCGNRLQGCGFAWPRTQLQFVLETRLYIQVDALGLTRVQLSLQFVSRFISNSPCLPCKETPDVSFLTWTASRLCWVLGQPSHLAPSASLITAHLHHRDRVAIILTRPTGRVLQWDNIPNTRGEHNFMLNF